MIIFVATFKIIELTFGIEINKDIVISSGMFTMAGISIGNLIYGGKDGTKN